MSVLGVAVLAASCGCVILVTCPCERNKHLHCMYVRVNNKVKDSDGRLKT